MESVTQHDISTTRTRCEQIETRILSRQAEAHHSLQILRLAPAETLVQDLADYAFQLETLLTVRRAVLVALKEQNDRLIAGASHRRAA